MVSLLVLVLFSFFYTDRVMNFINKKDPLMNKIDLLKDKYEVLPVNAVLDSNTIIPGVKGKSVDLDKSYENMKVSGIFREDYLVYNDILPSEMLSNNMDKYIIGGNTSSNRVSLLVITNYDNITNGEDFMTVIHASYLEPGVKGELNYHDNEYSKQYLSCSLISDRELNTFGDAKTLFVMDVNSDSYIASSFVDSVTSETTEADFNTLKEIDVNGNKHYIKVGYTNDMKSSVTSISSPKMIEGLSLKRELKDSGELYRYNSLTNEVVLDRTKTKMRGAILLSDGCDLLLEEYLRLKSLGVKFKCINKGLYRQKSNISPYTDEEYNNFLISLDNLDDVIRRYNVSYEDLFDFYQEVVIPMKYDERVMNDINKKLSFYGIGASSGRGR